MTPGEQAPENPCPHTTSIMTHSPDWEKKKLRNSEKYDFLSVIFSRPEYKLTHVYPYIKKLPGADKTAIREAVVPAVMAYIDGLEIGGMLNIPKLCGVIYAAKPEIANTFVVTDI